MKRQQAKAKPNWKIHAYYLDACNCDWGCPCQFNAKPTHGNCEGLSGIHIIDGNYGSNYIRVDGLNMAFIGSWPGPNTRRTWESILLHKIIALTIDSLMHYQKLLQGKPVEVGSVCTLC